MFYYYDDFFEMLVFICLALFFLGIVMRMMRGSKKPSTAKPTASTATAQAVPKNQMAEDIKTTKTSAVADAVSILDDLGSTSQNYRHYCELVGTSMASGGVTAPYSRRQVAYYDIKCYRIDSTYGGGQEETLVAHEHSIDPFFFTDQSSDTPIYVDLESFGDNTILVNSTNHIEGPNSDFAKAVQKNASATTGSGAAYAIVARAVTAGVNALCGAADALRQALTPRPAFQGALALAGGGSLPLDESPLASRLKLAGPGGPDPRSSGRGSVNVQVGNGHVHVSYGPSHMPEHLGDFMGGYSSPWVVGGGPGYNRRRRDTDAAELILGMGLSALLNSMAATQQQVSQTTGGSNDTFRGYRLVENIVPLGSPIYCIGEIYRHGTDVYMARSLAKDYPTSYFATKPEAEVLSVIESR